MLPSLRHHPLVRGDDEQGEIDTGRPGEHGPDERFVPRYIDDTGDADPGQHEWREPELDRDPPLLLLRQTIGVDASEGANEGGLAVIDVPGGPDDHARLTTFSPPITRRRERLPRHRTRGRRGHRRGVRGRTRAAAAGERGRHARLT